MGWLSAAGLTGMSLWGLPAGAEAPPSLLRGVKDTTTIVREIGEGALNDTARQDVCGADLGSMFRWQGRTYLAFGDTFGCPLSATPHWRRNTMAVTRDATPADGLVFESWIADPDGSAKQLFPPEGGAVTVIPTSGVGVGETGYLFYMQVREWGTPGQWRCNYSSVATSTDAGQTWRTQHEQIQWPPGSFNQVAILPAEGFLYLWGIPCGRDGSVKLMRVEPAKILQKDQYEYCAGVDAASNPQWSREETDAVTVASGPVGELSVRWNAWLGRYLMMYLDVSRQAIVIREAATPWGPWGEPIPVIPNATARTLYGAYMLEGYDEADGETIYFRVSEYFPAYTTYWVSTTLVKAPGP